MYSFNMKNNFNKNYNLIQSKRENVFFLVYLQAFKVNYWVFLAEFTIFGFFKKSVGTVKMSIKIFVCQFLLWWNKLYIFEYRKVVSVL